MFYLFSAFTLVIGPLAGYFIAHTMNAAFVGLGLAAVLVAIVLLIDRIPLDVAAFALLGGAGGLITAKGLDWMVFKFDNAPSYKFMTDYSMLINILLVFVGGLIAVRKKSELDLLDKNLVVKETKGKDTKVLDTSVLIDGRIADIVETGFLSGRLIIPRFVLHELQLVADSQDAAKRQRGRRGLDIVRRIQENHEVTVKIYDKDYAHIKEVDSKLMELAREMDAKLVTTDFNLSKVAVLQGISILNVNDLAGAMKSVVLPGDAITIYLAKEGKEKAQAVGYLDDGTMVVVDDARRFMGKRANVHVNSILQTPAGRMIFARVNEIRELPSVDEKVPFTGSEAPPPAA